LLFWPLPNGRGRFFVYEKNEKGLRKSPDAIVGADAHGGPRGSGQIYAGIPGKNARMRRICRGYVQLLRFLCRAAVGVGPYVQHRFNV